jgi:DNA ligase-1
MKHFAELIKKLEQSNKTNDKINALVEYFNIADSKDKVWVIALFTGKKPKRPIKSSLLKLWAMEIIQMPLWLFTECYSNVGDLSETIALLIPPPTKISNLHLYQWIENLQNLEGKSDEEKKNFVINTWDSLEIAERFIFNKLISGNFRMGVSSKILVNALAKQNDIENVQIMHSIMGNWDPYSITFTDLIAGAHVNTDNSWPYPFCLAYPLEQEVQNLGAVEDWQAEWKWDGIRGQIVKRNDEIYIWSRGEELVTEQFPELEKLISQIPNGTVLDGEILAVKDHFVLPFNTLQQRLNRKTINKKQLDDAPIGFYVYDILEFEGKDIRQEPLKWRREILEGIIKNFDTDAPITISAKIHFKTWAELTELRQTARLINSEGLMLKNVNSLYHSGRKRGDWWKWKINPYTVDAVMIYAQKGSGRRANFYTDYTFAIRDGDELVTIAKAYSGLTDKEIKEVNSFVNKNAIERFGPVRTVKPELVFEIAFEGINESKRHKAGLALRFPRILRWRKDKKASEINTLDDLKSLLQESISHIPN